MKFPNCQTLDLELDIDWLTIWFNRPDARNALSAEMIAELTGLFQALKNTRDIRGITLRGRGGVFCVGGDLKEFKAIFQGGQQDVDDIARSSYAAGELFTLINETPQATVMLVEGAAMAGGFGIACTGDIVIVEESAKFAMTETAIGIPPAQIAPFVAARIGLPATRRLTLTAGRLDGVEAKRIGVADYTAGDVSGLEAIEADIRKQVRKCAPGANAATKEIVLATRYLDGPEMIKLAGAGFANAVLSGEGKEGVASFLEKRKPSWAETPSTKGA